MGGVNTSRNYAETMGFGHWDDDKQELVVTNTLKQGGIVSHMLLLNHAMFPSASNLNAHRLPFTIFLVRSLAVS